MGDIKAITECDGETGYQEFISDITQFAVLEECEHVLTCHGIKTQGPKNQRPAPPRVGGGP